MRGRSVPPSRPPPDPSFKHLLNCLEQTCWIARGHEAATRDASWFAQTRWSPTAAHPLGVPFAVLFYPLYPVWAAPVLVSLSLTRRDQEAEPSLIHEAVGALPECRRRCLPALDRAVRAELDLRGSWYFRPAVGLGSAWMTALVRRGIAAVRPDSGHTVGCRVCPRR